MNGTEEYARIASVKTFIFGWFGRRKCKLVYTPIEQPEGVVTEKVKLTVSMFNYYGIGIGYNSKEAQTIAAFDLCKQMIEKNVAEFRDDYIAGGFDRIDPTRKEDPASYLVSLRTKKLATAQTTTSKNIPIQARQQPIAPIKKKRGKTPIDWDNPNRIELGSGGIDRPTVSNYHPPMKRLALRKLPPAPPILRRPPRISAFRQRFSPPQQPPPSSTGPAGNVDPRVEKSEDNQVSIYRPAAPIWPSLSLPNRVSALPLPSQHSFALGRPSQVSTTQQLPPPSATPIILAPPSPTYGFPASPSPVERRTPSPVDQGLKSIASLNLDRSQKRHSSSILPGQQNVELSSLPLWPSTGKVKVAAAVGFAHSRAFGGCMELESNQPRQPVLPASWRAWWPKPTDAVIAQNPPANGTVEECTQPPPPSSDTIANNVAIRGPTIDAVYTLTEEEFRNGDDENQLEHHCGGFESPIMRSPRPEKSMDAECAIVGSAAESEKATATVDVEQIDDDEPDVPNGGGSRYDFTIATPYQWALGLLAGADEPESIKKEEQVDENETEERVDEIASNGNGHGCATQ